MPDRDPEPDPARSGAIVAALQALTVAVDRYADVRGGAHGLHRTDLYALAHVMQAGRRGEDLTPGALSASLNLSSPATSALLGRLERAGHVRREHDTADRRRVAVVMTDSAMDAGRAVFGPLGDAMRGVLATMPAADQQVVLDFLEAAVAATSEATEGTTGGRPPVAST
ncbi:MarR family winged helix-turn-helix transcriptional regulator [Angustibacter aerolatus]